MDSITLILTALTAGAGGQKITSNAIKDSYSGLKTLIQRKFAGKPKAELALAEYESDPETWVAPLKKTLAQEKIDQDQEVIVAAQNLIQLAQSPQSATGKFNVQIAGNVQGFVQGDSSTINISFPGDKSPR
jgi:hypothetical protein